MPRLLTPSTDQRFKTNTFTEVKRTNTLRRMKFVPTDTQKIHRDLAHVNSCLSHRLNRIRVKSNSVLFRDLTGLTHRLNDTGLIVRPHDTGETSLSSLTRFAKLIKTQPSFTIYPATMNLKSHIFHRLARPKNGTVFDLTCDHTRGLTAINPRQ